MRLVVRVLARLGLLKYFNIRVRVKLRNGNSVLFPIIQTMGLANLNLPEPWMEQVLEKVIPIKDGAFMDVGVNMGQTMVKMKSIKPEMEYFGFEPNPICVFYSKELAKVNHYKNIHIVSVGMAEQNVLLTLSFYGDNDIDSSASVVKDFRPQKIYKQEYVPCFSFDSIELAIRVKSFAIIKIDVEGAELSVLRGMENLIKKDRPIIVVEVLPVYSVENTDRMARQKEIEVITQNINYRILRIAKKDECFSHFDLIKEFGMTTSISDSDYLLCPTEIIDKVMENK